MVERIGIVEAATYASQWRLAVVIIFVVSAILTPEDHIISDELNHASIIDGCRLSKAPIKVFPHKDVAAARTIMEGLPKAQKKILITDGVFSMDGYLAKLDAICDLAERHDALVGHAKLGERSAIRFTRRHEVAERIRGRANRASFRGRTAHRGRGLGLRLRGGIRHELLLELGECRVVAALNDPVVEIEVAFLLEVAEVSAERFVLFVRGEQGARFPRIARIRKAIRLLDAEEVDFEYDGEMQADMALDYKLLKETYPFTRLTGPANVLVMPAFHSASISTKLLQELGGATVIGPILVGLDRPVQIVQLGAKDTTLVNMAALAAFNVSG